MKTLYGVSTRVSPFPLIPAGQASSKKEADGQKIDRPQKILKRRDLPDIWRSLNRIQKPARRFPRQGLF